MADPWTDYDIMHELYVEQNLTGKEISDHLDCSEYTTSVWIRNHGLKEFQSKNGVYFKRSSRGAGQIQIRHSMGDNTMISEHTLTLLGDGVDPHEIFNSDTEVHHKNKRAIDNRPANLKLVSRSDHQQLHWNAVWNESDGWPELLG